MNINLEYWQSKQLAEDLLARLAFNFIKIIQLGKKMIPRPHLH